MQIHVYPVPFSPRQKLAVPKGTRFLSVGMDMRNNVALWTLADEDNETVTVEVVMVRLHEELNPPASTHVGTFKDNSGIVFVFVNTDIEQPKPVEVVAKKKVLVATTA